MKTNTKKRRTDNATTSIYGSSEEMRTAPKTQIPKNPTEPRIAYQIVKDEAMLDGNARLNMATFVTTWMDEYATKLMTETMDKNMVDKSEYPQTAEIERRCVNIMAKLWNTPEAPNCTGASTIGSSEACMLGGMAALKRWKKARKAKGLPTDNPNFVISSAFQVVWEKFSHYWDVEMRTVPISMKKITMDTDEVIKLCDENTILVVPILGVTLTGLNDDVKKINDKLDKLNTKTGWNIAIHVDAASGGFIHPFVNPDLIWDFRLKWVYSISTSGHKFGMVYPGIGWIVWKDKKYLPEDMVFEVNYLGSEVGTISINFSRPGNQVLAQYFQFINLGFEGYKTIQNNILKVCKYLRERLVKLNFSMFSKDLPNPLFIWTLKPDPKRNWTLYDLSDRMTMDGWQIPAYTLSKDLENVVVMRIVVRQGTGIDLADLLIENIQRHIEFLNKLEKPSESLLAMQRNEVIKTRIYHH
ncbi:MAG TPA: glutamate decarboxylase [Ignavibacteria bacterium]|nr:glutamate decarboxylase [Ignavibacteria bacterium]HMR42135.1 glutamate decarboxylase [Ignavibacteria bacterium]